MVALAEDGQIRLPEGFTYLAHQEDYVVQLPLDPAIAARAGLVINFKSYRIGYPRTVELEDRKARRDTLYFYLRRQTGDFPSVNPVELVIGTQDTGDRIALAARPDTSYYYWRSLRDSPIDPTVLIRSREQVWSYDHPSLYHTLDMTRNDGSGYQAPLTTHVRLNAIGSFIITPILPALNFPPEWFTPQE